MFKWEMLSHGAILILILQEGNEENEAMNEEIKWKSETSPTDSWHLIRKENKNIKQNGNAILIEETNANEISLESDDYQKFMKN